MGSSHYYGIFYRNYIVVGWIGCGPPDNNPKVIMVKDDGGLQPITIDGKLKTNKVNN